MTLVPHRMGGASIDGRGGGLKGRASRQAGRQACKQAGRQEGWPTGRCGRAEGGVRRPGATQRVPGWLNVWKRRGVRDPQRCPWCPQRNPWSRTGPLFPRAVFRARPAPKAHLHFGGVLHPVVNGHAQPKGRQAGREEGRGELSACSTFCSHGSQVAPRDVDSETPRRNSP